MGDKSIAGGHMKAYDQSEKGKHDQATQQSLIAIDARLARHGKVTLIILVLVIVLVGLMLALLVAYLFSH